VVHVDTNNVVRVALVAIIVLVTLIFAPRKKEHGKYFKNPKTSRTNERAKEKNLLKKKKIRKDDTVRLGSCLVQHFKKHVKERERPQNKLEKSYFLICFIEQV
jgi:FtsZ-interacting cell division protein ZipA